MIEDIISSECPRYVKKEVFRDGESIQVIIDTHDGASRPIPIITSINDNAIDDELEKLNSDYELSLRKHFSRRGIQ